MWVEGLENDSTGPATAGDDDEGGDCLKEGE